MDGETAIANRCLGVQFNCSREGIAARYDHSQLCKSASFSTLPYKMDWDLPAMSSRHGFQPRHDFSCIQHATNGFQPAPFPIAGYSPTTRGRVDGGERIEVGGRSAATMRSSSFSVRSMPGSSRNSREWVSVNRKSTFTQKRRGLFSETRYIFHSAEKLPKGTQAIVDTPPSTTEGSASVHDRREVDAEIDSLLQWVQGEPPLSM